jgi:hypothetical protein
VYDMHTAKEDSDECGQGNPRPSLGSLGGATAAATTEGKVSTSPAVRDWPGACTIQVFRPTALSDRLLLGPPDCC